MRMGQGVRTGLGHGSITCVLQTQFSSFILITGGHEVVLCVYKSFMYTQMDRMNILHTDGYHIYSAMR